MQKKLLKYCLSAALGLSAMGLSSLIAEQVDAAQIEEAIDNNQVDAVLKFVAKAPGGINFKDDSQNSLLHMASGNPQVLAALLKLKPDLEAVNVVGYRPLHFAIKQGCMENVKMLLAAGADIKATIKAADAANDQTYDNALICVAHVEDPKTIDELGSLILSKEPKQLNAKGEDGYTALMHAADRGNLAFAKWLLAKGADKNAKNAEGQTALDCINGRIQLMKEDEVEPGQNELGILKLLSK